MALLRCQNPLCNYEWTYQGSQENYATCPRCRWKVNIKKRVLIEIMESEPGGVQEDMSGNR